MVSMHWSKAIIMRSARTSTSRKWSSSIVKVSVKKLQEWPRILKHVYSSISKICNRNVLKEKLEYSHLVPSLSLFSLSLSLSLSIPFHANIPFYTWSFPNGNLCGKKWTIPVFPCSYNRYGWVSEKENCHHKMIMSKSTTLEHEKV